MERWTLRRVVRLIAAALVACLLLSRPGSVHAQDGGAIDLYWDRTQSSREDAWFALSKVKDYACGPTISVAADGTLSGHCNSGDPANTTGDYVSDATVMGTVKAGDVSFTYAINVQQANAALDLHGTWQIVYTATGKVTADDANVSNGTGTFSYSCASSGAASFCGQFGGLKSESFSGTMPWSAVLPLSPTAAASTLRGGLACDTKDLDLAGTVVCAASAEGAPPNAMLTFDWTVDGIAQAKHDRQLPLNGIDRGDSRTISVVVRDTGSRQAAPAVQATIARPAQPGQFDPTIPVIVVAGAAVAVVLAVATLRPRRRTSPALPTAPQASTPGPTSSGGVAVSVSIAVETSALTRGRYADGAPRMLGDDADIATAACSWRIQPPGTRVVGPASVTWTASPPGVVAGGQGLNANGAAVPDPLRCLVRARWSDTHAATFVSATVTVPVIGPDGKPQHATGSGQQWLGVIGAYPEARLELSPGSVDLDGTSLLAVSPSLYVFDALFAGEVVLVEIPCADPTLPDVPGAPCLALGAEAASDPQKVGRYLERQTSLPAKRVYFRARLRTQPPGGLALCASVRPLPTPLGPELVQRPLDRIVERHIAACASHVGTVATAPVDLGFGLRAVRPLLEVQDPELPVEHPPDGRPDWNPVARLRVRLTRGGGQDVDDQDFTRDIPKAEVDAWTVAFRFASVVNPCWTAARFDPPWDERPLHATGSVHAGYLVVADPSRPGQLADYEICYDHATSFRPAAATGQDDFYLPARGDGAHVQVRASAFGMPGPIAADRPVAIRVEPWSQVARYVDDVNRPGEKPGQIRTRVNLENSRDGRIAWYKANAVPEDWLRLVDYAGLDHEFWPDGLEDPLRCRREPCTATRAYHCHDYAWRPLARTAPTPRHIDTAMVPRIVAGDAQLAALIPGILPGGYDELAAYQWAQPGDVVAFYALPASATPDHSAVVTSNEGGRVTCRSKDVVNSLFVHVLAKDDMSDWFYRQYGQHQLRYFRPRGVPGRPVTPP